jgi:hypothetical protein
MPQLLYRHQLFFVKLIYHQVTHKGADKYRAEKSIDEAIGSILLFGNKIIIGTGRGQIEQWRFHREEFKLVREHVYSYDQVFLFVFFFVGVLLSTLHTQLHSAPPIMQA